MGSQTESLPSTVVKKEEDVPEVTIDSPKGANGRNITNGVIKDGSLNSPRGGLIEVSEDTATHAGAEGEDEASRLKALATGMRDQDDLERDINRQVGHQGLR